LNDNLAGAARMMEFDLDKPTVIKPAALCPGKIGFTGKVL